jgi:hypothetical protein
VIVVVAASKPFPPHSKYAGVIVFVLLNRSVQVPQGQLSVDRQIYAFEKILPPIRKVRLF